MNEFMVDLSAHFTLQCDPHDQDMVMENIGDLIRKAINEGAITGRARADLEYAEWYVDAGIDDLRLLDGWPELQDYTIREWKEAVASGCTRMGYQDWVLTQRGILLNKEAQASA